MITFDRENEIFCLNTKSTTYVMGINGGKLFHRYWGKRLVNPLGITDLSDYEKRNFPALDLDGGNTTSCQSGDYEFVCLATGSLSELIDACKKRFTYSENL